jgi:hypothetical protein
MTGPKRDDLLQVLADSVPGWIGFEWSQSKGFHGFGERLSCKFPGQPEVASVQWGGRQDDRLMIEVKGEHTPAVVDTLRSRFRHRCTRVDSCADFDGPKVFERLYRQCRKVKTAHRIVGGKAGDWDDFPERGRTLYLGAQSSPTRLRLYEKGLQREYAHLQRPDWSRLEVQVRPQKDAREVFAGLSAVDVWGASRWSRELATAVLLEHVDPHPAGSVYRLSDREMALGWMCKQYGPHLVSLANDLGGWAELGLTLGEMVREASHAKQARR